MPLESFLRLKTKTRLLPALSRSPLSSQAAGWAHGTPLWNSQDRSIHNIRDGETWPRDVKQLAHIIRLMSDGTRIGTPVELRGTALNQVALQVPRAGWRVETVSYLEFPWSSAELNAVSYLSPSMRTVHLTSLPCYKTFNSITYRVKPQVLALAYLSSVIDQDFRAPVLSPTWLPPEMRDNSAHPGILNIHVIFFSFLSG